MIRRFFTLSALLFSLLMIVPLSSSHAQKGNIVFDRAIETMLKEPYIEATAFGYGRNKQTAKDAAIDGASVSLLSRVLGARVTSERVTSDGESMRNYITSQIEGTIIGHYISRADVHKFEDSNSPRNRYEAEVTLRIPVAQPAMSNAIAQDLGRWEKENPADRYKPDYDLNAQKVLALEDENRRLTEEIQSLKNSSRPEDKARLSQLLEKKDGLQKELNDLLGMLREKNIEIESLKQELSQRRESPSAGPYSGLIIDATGLHLETAMAPKIYTKVDGKLRQIYGFTNVPDHVWLNRGMVEYAKNVNEAKRKLKKRIGNTPLVVKAQDGYGNRYKTDVILSHQDAVKVFESDLRDLFLERGKVVFVID